MKIVVVGSGNVGTQIAVHCCIDKNNEVYIYSSKPEKISKTISIVNENDELLFSGDIAGATSNREIFKDADLIFVTYPAFMMEGIAKEIENYANENLYICLVPGTGGGECAFKKCIMKGATIFGLQRVPSVARLVEYGKIVKATGYRDKLFVGSLPQKNVEKCSQIVSNIFKKECGVLPNYLNLTLTPSNPILHTVRLKTIFKDYYIGKSYDRNPLFYEEWDNETSDLIFKCDDEVQNICKALDEFDLSYVNSLKNHYESNTIEELTNKIKSITGFKGLYTPMINEGDKYYPDFNSRYFTADFPYGLYILIQIADLLNIEHINMLETYEWYKKFNSDIKEFKFTDYGINNINNFIEFYSK